MTPRIQLGYRCSGYWLANCPPYVNEFVASLAATAQNESDEVTTHGAP
jgi:hypothetical protein